MLVESALLQPADVDGLRLEELQDEAAELIEPSVAFVMEGMDPFPDTTKGAVAVGEPASQRFQFAFLGGCFVLVASLQNLFMALRNALGIQSKWTIGLSYCTHVPRTLTSLLEIKEQPLGPFCEYSTIVALIIKVLLEKYILNMIDRPAPKLQEERCSEGPSEKSYESENSNENGTVSTRVQSCLLAA